MTTRALTPKTVLGPLLWGLALVLLIGLTRFASAYAVIFITSVLMYVVLAMSWAMFSGPTGYISLAPAAFFGLGIYTAAVLGMQMSLALVILIAGLASFALALLVGALTLRLRGIYFAIFTVGLVELIKNVVLWYEVTFTGTRGRFVVPVDNVTIYYIMLGILVLLMLTAYLIRRSRFGLALQAIGEDELAAAHVGVNVDPLKTIIFAVSAIFMGAAGAIMATRWSYIDPYIAFNPLFSFIAVLMAIFGGLGKFYGPILGAVLIAYLEEALITRFPYQYMLIFGLVLVASILYLPGGLVSLAPKLRNLTARRRRADSGG
jgi:branched-chain amino acid transport system permease protein